MKKRKRVTKRSHPAQEPISWLPIDSRIIPLVSFPHVRGVARFFIIIEMTLSVLMLVAAFILVILAKIH